MERPLSALEKLQLAYDLVAEVLGQAPQLHETCLDQALLVLLLAIRRARRSPHLRPPPPSRYRDQELQF